MKTHYFVLLIFGILVIGIFGCEKARDTNTDQKIDGSKEPPEIPASDSLDINGDAITDFVIDYPWYVWDGVNASGDGISGRVEPLNGNMVLGDYYRGYIFSNQDDTIFSDVSAPLEWDNLGADVVSIATTAGYFWPEHWRILSNLYSERYYLGIKLNGKPGWLEMQIDSLTGGIVITDKNTTEDDYIIVGK